MAKPRVTAERAEAAADRRAAAFWDEVARQDPGRAPIARGIARDMAAEARSEDQAAERQIAKPRGVAQHRR
jgi:hypothetical protein